MIVGRVAVLCTRRSSPYLSIEGADCFDADRDCRSFDLAAPVVAHPPCRSWSRLRSFARPRPDEQDVALWCLDAVRRCGGVLEDPEGSHLLRFLVGCWRGRRDAWGGFVVRVDQSEFGHRARKSSWLYVVRRSLPASPIMAGLPSREVAVMGLAERERTPPAFARWLVDLARGAA